MNYAGFWVRLAAGLIDFIIFLPLMLFYFWIESHSRIGSLIMVIPYHLFYAAFCIMFLGKYGKTPGKMLMKIAVTHIDGSSIGYREALLRHSVDAIFGFIAGVGMLIAVFHTDYAVFSDQLTWMQRNKIIMENTPTFATLAGSLSILWGYSELIVLLFNKKKRAIHDFIAGTVVVHTQKHRMANQEEAAA